MIIDKTRLFHLFKISLAGILLGLLTILIIKDLSVPFKSFLMILMLLTLFLLYQLHIKSRIKRIDIFEPPVFMSFYFFIGLGLFSFQFFFSYPLDENLEGNYYWLNLALFYVALGIVILWLGYYSRISLWIDKKLFEGKKWWTQKYYFRFENVSVLLYILGFSARIYAIIKGVWGYLAEYEKITVSEVKIVNLLKNIEYFCTYALVLAAIDSFMNPLSKRKKLFLYLFFILECASIMYSGFKRQLFYTFLYVAIPYFYVKKKLPVKFIVAAFIAVLILIPINIIYREMVLYADELEVTNIKSIYNLGKTSFQRVIEKGELSDRFTSSIVFLLHHETELQYLAVMIKKVPEKIDYLRGKYYFQFPFLVFIPRFIWPGKPLMQSGYEFWTQILEGNPDMKHSVGETYMGNLYWNFGLAGIIAGMFLTGILQRVTYKRFFINKPHLLFFVPFLFFGVAMPQSDVVSHYVGLVQQFIILLIISKFVFKPEII